MVFSLLRYNRLLSWYIAHYEQQKTSRKVELFIAKNKLLRIGISGELNFSHWRFTKAAEIHIFVFSHYIGYNTTDRRERNLVLFSSRMSFGVKNSFMENLPEFEYTSRSKFEFIGGIIVTIPCQDVLIATSISCLRSNEMKKVGHNREKFYHDTFALFYPKAFDQVLRTIRMFTQVWNFTELSLSALSINYGFQMSETVQNATMEIYMSSLKQQLVNVFANCSLIHNFGAWCES